MGFGPSAPPPQNYYQQTSDTLAAQVAEAPAVYSANATYLPQYATLQDQTLSDALLGNGTTPGVLQLYQQNIDPTLSELNLQNTEQQRQADVNAVQTLGPQATAAYKAANPQQATLIDQLNQQATAGLAAGGTLTPQQQEQVQQAARSASSARGLGNGPSDVYAETSLLGQAGFQRQQANQAFASNVVGLNAATTIDPFQAILGRPAQSSTAGTGLLGQLQQQSSGAGASATSLFNPQSSYAQNLYDTNFNAANAQYLQGQNLLGSLLGGGLGFAGSVGGGLFQGAGNAGGFGNLFG